jgi:hypothetical protein
MFGFDWHFRRIKQKKEGKLVSTSLPSLWRKCNADLDYKSVTDTPEGRCWHPAVTIPNQFFLKEFQRNPELSKITSLLLQRPLVDRKQMV